MKVKLRDLTLEQFKEWKENECDCICGLCPFKGTNCDFRGFDCWIFNEEIFSDKFLEQEIEIDCESILTEEEREYLSNIIKPFRDRVEYIRKEHSTGGECITISLKNEGCFYPYEDFTLPIFEEGKYYKRMELFLEYTLGELGL